MGYTRVVIIGGGFAGLNVAKGLAKTEIDVTLVDKTNHHLFQPLLYQVASSALSPADIASPIRENFKTCNNVYVVMANVISVDKHLKRISLENGDEIHYDYLVIAAGSRHSYFGHPEWEPFATGLKTLADALDIREKILISFEKAERCDSYKEAAKYLNFVIVGGGPTGVELAGAIAEIAHQTMLKNFRRIDTTKTRVYLIESHPYVLPPFPPSLGRRAQEDLEKLGVKIINNRRSTNITKEGVYIDQDFIESRNVFWAAGVQASPLLKTLDTELDHAGRALVNKDCSLAGNPEIFVIGDAAHFKTDNGNFLPGLSPVAIQQGRYVAKILKKQIPVEKRKPFKYINKGMMATIGKYKAVAQTGPFKFKGLFAWCIWMFIHIFYLIGFRHKIIVMIEWAFFFIAGQRNVRIIKRPLKDDISHKSTPPAAGTSMPDIERPEEHEPFKKSEG